MNISCANDDEDFPVFKAGPPLPIRTKTKPSCKIKGAPLKATSLPPKNSSKHGGISTHAATNSSVNTESKVKQYIEKVKASDELGRKKRIKPEKMLSLEELYQVSVVASDSKCERSDNYNNISGKNKQEQFSTDVQDKLRQTLRIVKEKDELINKLRESCHDLAIKCADAENRVDELRFSYGRSSFSVGTDKDATNSNKEKSEDLQLPKHSAFIPRRCVSEDGLHTCGVGDGREEEQMNWKKIDKATETSCDLMKYDAHTQIETRFCSGGQYRNERLSDQHAGECKSEDDILQETCSNWLEKVQNWKTDSTFNLSQDSGGDKDSGFRGSSAEIDAESVLKHRHNSLIKSHRKCHGHGERLKAPCFQRYNTIQLPEMSSSSTVTISAQPACVHQENQAEGELSTQQHFWPSFSSSQSHFHLTASQSANFHSDSIKAKSLFYEMAEANRNKYVCFQEECRNNHHRTEFPQHQLGGAKSLDALYIPSPVSQPTKEELKSLIDSSFDPPEFILKSYLNSQHRSVDKKVKILGPLLDDTTQIALRVKMKSERLAKMLSDACTLE